MKNKYFKFYTGYYDEFNKLSVFKIKKLLKALCDYAEYGFLTQKLDKKSNEIFEKIKNVQIAERAYYMNMGKKGAKNRWIMAENGGDDRGAIRGGNRGAMPKKWRVRKDSIPESLHPSSSK